MRDEDLKNLPQSIERWKVAELLADLGITDHRNVQELRFEPRRIYARVLATDEKGQHYADGASVAVHEISIPFVGEWEKPAEATQPCGSRCSEGDERCELPEGHYFCRSGGTSWPHPGSEVRFVAPDEDLQDCTAWEARDGYRWQCAMPLGHDGGHSYRLNTGRMLRDAPQA